MKTNLESPPAGPASDGNETQQSAGEMALAATRNEVSSQRRERIDLLKRKPAFLVGAVITLMWTTFALFGSWIAPQDPYKQNLMEKLKEPSIAHWFGTDDLGRDVFSRVISGTRVILLVAFGATIIATIVGTAMGLAAGYFKGLTDEILMRIADVLVAMPVIVFALLIIAIVQSKSSLIVMLIIATVFAPIIARTVRASVLGEAELDYVAAARLRSESSPHILFAELLPNIAGPLLVEFTVRLGYAVFAVATLSFLGAGVSPTSPDWGTQVATQYGYLNGLNWSATLFPALAIALLSIGVNLVADGLTEIFER